MAPRNTTVHSTYATEGSPTALCGTVASFGVVDVRARVFTCVFASAEKASATTTSVGRIISTPFAAAVFSSSRAWGAAPIITGHRARTH